MEPQVLPTNLPEPQLPRDFLEEIDPERIDRLIVDQMEETPGLMSELQRARVELYTVLTPVWNRFKALREAALQELREIRADALDQLRHLNDVLIPQTRESVQNLETQAESRRAAFYAHASRIGIDCEPTQTEVMAAIERQCGYDPTEQPDQTIPKTRGEMKRKDQLITWLFGGVTGCISAIAIGELTNFLKMSSLNRWSLGIWLGAIVAAGLGIVFAYLFHLGISMATRFIYRELYPRKRTVDAKPRLTAPAVLVFVLSWIVVPCALMTLDTHGLQKGLDEHRAATLRSMVVKPGSNRQSRVPETPIWLTGIMAMALTAGLLWTKGIMSFANCKSEEELEQREAEAHDKREQRRREVYGYFRRTPVAAEALRMAQDIAHFEREKLRPAQENLKQYLADRQELMQTIKQPTLPEPTLRQLEAAHRDVQASRQRIRDILDGVRPADGFDNAVYPEPPAPANGTFVSEGTSPTLADWPKRS